MELCKNLRFLVLLLVVLLPAPALAQVTFYVIEEGDSSIRIEGADIDANSDIELTVVYDAQVMANPQVKLDYGTLTDVSDSAGVLVVHTVHGDDPNATFSLHLSFDKKRDGRTEVYSVTGTIAGPDGSPAAARTLPGGNPPVLQTFSRDEEMPSEEEPGSSCDIPEIVKSERNVLQRFRNYQGKRGLKAFVALFERAPGERVVQAPTVAVSDGKTPVSIYLEGTGKEGGAPDVALSDAKLIAVERLDGKRWLITALPNQGTWESTVIVRADGAIFEAPLVVAPPLDLRTGISERNFLYELDRQFAGRSVAVTGQSERQRRVLQEYIFTANYLARASSLQHVVAGK